MLTCIFFQYKPFLDGIQYAVVSIKVKKYLDEIWPLILQATVLDAVPLKFKTDNSSNLNINDSKNTLSGHSMVGLESNEYHFLWGLSQLIMFQAQKFVSDTQVKKLFFPDEKRDDVSALPGAHFMMTSCEIALIVFQSLSTEAFFSHGFLSTDFCTDLLQVNQCFHP